MFAIGNLDPSVFLRVGLGSLEPIPLVHDTKTPSGAGGPNGVTNQVIPAPPTPPRPRGARRPNKPGPPYYCVRYFTGFFIIVQSPVLLSNVQLQKASQLSLSIFGLSARK